MRTWRGLGGMARSVYGEPEPRRGRDDRQRALRQAGGGLERVVAAGRDVVRRVRVEDRRQQLDLLAAHAELVLAAAVGAHLALLAELVAGEQRLDGAEARRLEVDRARQHRRGEDVRHGGGGGVPGDPVTGGGERAARLL